MLKNIRTQNAQPQKRKSKKQTKLESNEYYQKIIAIDCCQAKCLQNWSFCDVKDYVSAFALKSNKEQGNPIIIAINFIFITTKVLLCSD